jgi:mannose-6-phosphate isomerase-like protein (cupin superfamily)
MNSKIEKINLNQKFEQINDYWNPKIAGELNGQHIKLAKFKGEFIWHKHDFEDEMFLVVKGKFTMEFRDYSVELFENDFLIVPRGVEHRPVALEEVSVLLFEPVSTINTGDINNERTITKLDEI